jgi:hypothetical protein
VIDALMKAAGINPAQIQAQAQEIHKEYTAFKSGFRQAMAFFSGETAELKARLERMEKQHDEILALLRREQPSANMACIEDMRTNG